MNNALQKQNSNKQWTLGYDLGVEDNLLDCVTFSDLILAVHCNCRDITEEAVKKELKDIISIHTQDMEFLFRNNMKVIIREARRGRE